MPTTFITSPSAIDAYWTCAYRYFLSRKWTVLATTREMADGNAAHAILEGKLSPQKASLRARNFAETLSELEKNRGYKILAREVDESVLLTRGIVLHQRKDAYAELKGGQVVVIDYKTTGRMWEEVFGGWVPKAHTYQADAYLVKTPSGYGSKDVREVHFLVADDVGNSDVFVHPRSALGKANLIDAARGVKTAKVFPMHRGINCGYCPFFNACWDVPGWRGQYRARGAK